MSEVLELGDADADARWIGIRRHQAALVVAGLGLVGDWVVRAHGVILEAEAGGLSLLCAIPAYDGLTIGELLAIGIRYWSRSRWTSLVVVRERRALSLRARGHALLQGFELQHRGRLDLSGRDLQSARDLASFADALATSEQSRHVSLHVSASSQCARTLLSLPEATDAPDGWSENHELVLDVAGLTGGADSMWLLERWRYLRSSSEVIRVMRIRDFTAVPDGQALLEHLQQSTGQLVVALHFDVVGGARAQRIAARAVHRSSSDGAASHAVGFRRTARADRALERLGQRESLVASGRALLRIAVYVSVHASTHDQLHHDVQEVLRSAHGAGLRCERGVGRQALWHSQQLPGGPGW